MKSQVLVGYRVFKISQVQVDSGSGPLAKWSTIFVQESLTYGVKSTFEHSWAGWIWFEAAQLPTVIIHVNTVTPLHA